MFIISLCTKCRIHGSNSSLLNAVKLKDKWNFLQSPCCFTFYKSKYHDKSGIFLDDLWTTL